MSTATVPAESGNTTLPRRQVELLRACFRAYARWRADWERYLVARAKAEDGVCLFHTAIEQGRASQYELAIRGASMTWRRDQEQTQSRRVELSWQAFRSAYERCEPLWNKAGVALRETLRAEALAEFAAMQEAERSADDAAR